MRTLLKITDVIDIETLQKIQDAFSEATELASVAVDDKGNPMTEYSRFSQYCRSIRKERHTRDLCFWSDAHASIKAARSGKPSIYVCHGGLVDMAIPILVKGRYLGAIMAGQVRIDEQDMNQLPLNDERTDFNQEPYMRKLYEKTYTKTLSQMRESATLLFTLINALVEKRLGDLEKEELKVTNLTLQEEVKQRRDAEEALKEADFMALQAQINPHFLFNVLNTIGRLALLEGADKTQEIIYSFSDMMRYSLKKGKCNFVTLKEELENVQNYLNIQKMRIGNRLDYSIELDETIEDVVCPFMMIQTLAENAVAHGIEPHAKGGKISITAEGIEEVVVLKISDNGKGIEQKRLSKIQNGTFEVEDRKNAGIGIKNVNDRLEYHYGPTCKLEIRSKLGKGTEVSVKIPRKFMI